MAVRPIPMMLLAGLAGMLVAGELAAQSLQRLSVQGSGALLFASGDNPANDPGFENHTRLGYEGQLRYTISRWSIGTGYQRSTVHRFSAGEVEFTAALSLGFLEPRYLVAAGNRAAWYLAGRLGLGKLICSEECNANDWYAAYGGGSGILLRLSNRAALDLGGQFFVVSDNTGYAMLRLGLGFGL